MTVKERTHPCTQPGAYVSTPNKFKAFVIGPDPKDEDRVLIEYESKNFGQDSYPARMLTLVQTAFGDRATKSEAVNSLLEAQPPQADTQLERNLKASLHNTVGADDHWEIRRQNGLTDAQLKEAIAKEFGIAGGGGRNSDFRAHKVDKGSPKFWNQAKHRGG